MDTARIAVIACSTTDASLDLNALSAVDLSPYALSTDSNSLKPDNITKRHDCGASMLFLNHNLY